jgi:hypothetical protein
MRATIVGDGLRARSVGGRDVEPCTNALLVVGGIDYLRAVITIDVA